MRIAFHVGAHFTDDERLLRSFLKERGALSQYGIAVPGPKRYRSLLRDTVIGLKGKTADEDTELALLDQIMDQDEAERLILSWDSFLSLPPWVLKGRLYPSASERVKGLIQLFPSHECEFFLAIRNPASFLPALFHNLKSTDIKEFLAGVDPFDVTWSEMIERLMNDCPSLRLTVWSDEDTPLIWPEVTRAVAGLPDTVELSNDLELLGNLISGEGMTRLNAYLISHPPSSTLQRRKIVSAFLDKFALPDRISFQTEMPGWSQSMVDEISELYEEDLARIAHFDAIDYISA